MFSSKKYDNPSELLQLDKTKNDQQKPSRFGAIDNLYFDFASPPYQNMIKGADFQLEDDQGVKKHSPFASLRIVKDYASRSRKLIGEKIHIPSSNTVGNDRKLSTIERIRMAGLHFIDSYSNSDEISNPNPFSSPGLSDEEAKDINLLLTLLASADKTGQRHFNEAIKLIESCNNTSSNEGTTVQRLVYYFSEAIREKINRETGGDACDGLERMQMFDLQKALMGIDASIVAFHQKVPMAQVCQFTSMHTIVENLGRARHVHIIDLEIRSGMQYIVLMQAIASRSDWQLKHLKITAIGTVSQVYYLS
ncbi:scarecrow-like protein 23 [Bidens hawaiensis]|uniref:scarecrow-like protein 23 n=1 Tax=Bidens hawaiensis TaxID=980011 RepID=UPI00404AF4E7